MNDSLSTGYHFVKLCQEKRLASSQKMQEPVPMLEYSLPRLPSSWTWASLSEVCERVSVGHVGATTQYFVDSNQGVPLIRSQDVRPGKLMLKNAARVSFDFYKKQKKSQLKVGDVLIVRVGANRGDVCVVPHGVGEINCANIVFARPIYPNGFIGYYFQSEYGRELLLSVTTGSAQGVLNTQTIARIPVPIPPLDTQKKIVSILSAYDDLIENNTRRIEILEEMARSLYREWFVNFRFPGHEQVKMVDSELGLIPEGWEVKKLDELGSIGRGKSKHRPRNDPSLYGGDYPFVQTGEVKEALLYITHYTQTYNEKGLAQSKLWEPKTLLLTIAANIAETAILTIPACFPDSIVGFVADSEQVTPEFIKFRIDDIKEKMQSFSRGTAQDNLSLDKIKVFDFLVPGKDCIQLFDKYTAPLFSQVQNLLLKNANLRHTRDLLLPKLISGEIDVENFHNNTKELAA